MEIKTMKSPKEVTFEIFRDMEMNPEKYDNKYMNDVFNTLVRNGWLDEYCVYSADLFAEFGL
jgi:hypothetical protein